jgi:hypothetical protein
MATVKKLKKAQSGERLTGRMIGRGGKNIDYSVDTTGYAAGKKSFPANVKTTIGKKNIKDFEGEVRVPRGAVKDFIKGKTIKAVERQKHGGKVGSKKTTSMMEKGGKLKKSK